MNQDLYIVTGASRGLGLEIARQLLARRCLMVTLARGTHAGLTDAAAASGATLLQWSLDVAHPAGAAARLESWLLGVDSRNIGAPTLINNAGALGRVGPIEQMSGDELATVLRINLEAPMALTAAFLRTTATWKAPRKVLNISSGAGRRPIHGWAAYCASKAGLDHFARVTALDEARKANGARIVSLAPGVIDTDMQEQLRASDPAGFPEHEHFVELHTTGQLLSPAQAAAKVLSFLARDDFGREPVAAVRS
jgi:NAD(P)-dependent dehydrogenase (short-subunit alcohol dehydrogenase family)